MSRCNTSSSTTSATTDNGDFLWLSSVRPSVAPATPFAPDLQAWTRDEFLDPDWLRIGTDIVGGNAATTFEPSTWAMMIFGFAGVGFMAYRRSRKDQVFALPD